MMLAMTSPMNDCGPPHVPAILTPMQGKGGTQPSRNKGNPSTREGGCIIEIILVQIRVGPFADEVPSVPDETGHPGKSESVALLDRKRPLRAWCLTHES